MGRTKGLLPLSGNFEPQVAGPFDARSRVETKADLLLLATWQAKDGNPYTYVGMVVTVYADATEENNGQYLLLSDDYTSPLSWKQVGYSEIIESETPPNSPKKGLRWLNLTNGIEYTYIQNAWVDLNASNIVTLSHAWMTDKNSEAAFQHVDERINEMPAEVGAASYTLLNRRQNLITGTLPNGVNSALVIPALIAGERNEVILHFKTNATAAPTLVYSGFTPAWLNGNAISMKVNKQYTIVFEQINGIVKTSWGEY